MPGSGNPSRRLPAAALAVILAMTAGCGGGSATTNSTESAPETAATQARAHGSPKSGPERRSRESRRAGAMAPGANLPGGRIGGRAASFATEGGDNSIQAFGEESSASELRQAAAALHGYLGARAAGDWARACDNASAGFRRSLRHFPAGSRKEGNDGCPRILAVLAAGIPPAARRDSAVARAGALRINGARGFLLFHGADRTDYFMPMAKEAGIWKVAAIAASPLP